MKLHSLLAALVLSASTSIAAAQDNGGVTLRAFGGLSTLGDANMALGGTTTRLSFSGSTIAGFAVGYDYANSPFRSEVEFAYRSSSASGGVTGDYASTSIMFNGRYSFAEGAALTPYVGAGLGYVTEIDFDIATGGAAGQYADRGLVAGQLMLGADWMINENWSAFGEARYFTTAKTPTLTNSAGDALQARYRSTDVVVGLMYKF